MGSAPGLSTKIIGVPAVESVKAPFRSKPGDSMNILPSKLKTKFLIKSMSFSYLSSLYMIIFWNISSLSYKLSGSLTSSGFYYSKIFLQIASLSLFVSSLTTDLKGAVMPDRSTKSRYIFSVMKVGSFSGS